MLVFIHPAKHLASLLSATEGAAKTVEEIETISFGTGLNPSARFLAKTYSGEGLASYWPDNVGT